MTSASASNAEMVLDLRRELGELSFFGQPIGQTLDPIFIIDLLNDRGDWSARRQAHDVASFWRQYVLPSQQSPLAPVQSEHHRYVLAKSSDDSRLSDLIQPVVEQLGAERCSVLMPSHWRKASDHRDTGKRSPTREEMKEWRQEYSHRAREWRKIVTNAVTRHRFPNGLICRLDLALLLNSQRLFVAKRDLEGSELAAILVDYDRGAWAPLILAARVIGVPTFTLVHGVISPGALGYAPPLADRVLCWGDLDRSELTLAGVAPERIRVVGCPRLTRSLSYSSQQAKTRLDLPIDKPAVMLATSPISPADCHQLVSSFCQAVSSARTLSAFVRTHPAEDINSYTSVSAAYPTVRFTSAQERPLEEALAASDVVVVNDSGVGSDALVKRRPTIVFDVLTRPMGHGRRLVDLAGCQTATTPSDLMRIIDLLINDRGRREAALRAADTYVASFCAFFGDSAAREVASILT